MLDLLRGHGLREWALRAMGVGDLYDRLLRLEQERSGLERECGRLEQEREQLTLAFQRETEARREAEERAARKIRAREDSEVRVAAELSALSGDLEKPAAAKLYMNDLRASD